MNSRVALLLALASVLVVCGGCDRSITHGADGDRDWARRLAAAVPVGIPADSARALLERNGFHCQAGVDSVASLWCEKESGGRDRIVRRHWQAVLTVDADNRVAEVRASTGLVGP
jgi:hypothetical protein